MHNEELDNAIRKIKKCLELSKSTNENEASTALRQAHFLMRKFNINQSDLQHHEKIYKSVSKARSSINNWHNELINIIKNFFNIVPILTHDRKGINWYGSKLNTDIGGYAYDVLYKKCSDARLEYMKSKLKRCKRANKIKRADDFALAWTYAVKDSIKHLLDDEENQARNAYLKDLVLSKRDDLIDVKTRKSGNNKFNLNDYWNGRASGQNISLYRPIENEAETILLE